MTSEIQQLLETLSDYITKQQEEFLEIIYRIKKKRKQFPTKIFEQARNWVGINHCRRNKSARNKLLSVNLRQFLEMS